MIDRLRRDTPLAACPNLTCRRSGICHHLAQNGNCLKTSFASHDDWCIYMTGVIRKILASCPPPDPNEPELPLSDAMANLYKAFQKRVAEHEAELAAGNKKNVH